MAEYDEDFIEMRKQDLMRMQKELQNTLQMETEDFNQLMTEISTKDAPEVAKELMDNRSLGQVEVIDRERIRSIASALYRIEHGDYGVCISCGAQIAPERLKIKPDAAFCISCRERSELG
ncbi:MAG: TraR/DksA family transcriptional regulator [Spirochaeta sp.]